MRIAVITDAWLPQMNGVVRTLTTIIAQLRSRGHEVQVTSPDLYRNFPCPSYPEIRLALAGKRAVGKRLADFHPDAIHIATEGPLGWAARAFCIANKRPFTTAYHTQFPEYVARRTGIAPQMIWPLMRRFHQPAERTMVATETIREQLRSKGITRLHHWSRGVDLEVFGPDHPPPDLFLNLPRPIQLYVGRVAVEKNIEAFLANTHHGSKVVVGDGPALSALKAQFPTAHFLGKRGGTELAACYAGADVFVFPSKSDTFGLVMIEALACGTPVAAYRVAGPIDVLCQSSGAMADRLEDAIAQALCLDRKVCLEAGRAYSWQASADQFLTGLTPIGKEPEGGIITPALT